MKLNFVLAVALSLSVGVAHSESLNFDLALHRIVEKSTAPLRAQAILESTRAQSWPTRLHWVPSLELQSLYGSTRQGANSSTRYLQGSLVSSVTLFHFGADMAGAAAARSLVRSEEAHVKDVNLQTQARAGQALTDWVGSQLKEQVHRRLFDVQERSFKNAAERFQRGLLPKQELDKSEIDLESARARWVDAQNETLRAQANVESLVGERFEIQTLWPWKERLVAYRAPELRSLDQIPQWNQTTEALRAQESLAAQANRKLFPSLDARMTLGKTSSNGMFSGNFGSSSTGELILSWPFWDRLERYSARRSQSALREAAQLDQESTRRSLDADWYEIRSRFARSVESAQRREKTLQKAQALYDVNMERFRSGRTTVNDLAIDQARLAEAELLLVDGWRQAHVEFIRICHAQGLPVDECR